MRIEKKSHAKIGHAKALHYRTGVFSPMSDIEALVDAYGVDAIIKYARAAHNGIAKYGDSIHNGIYNLELNALPLPSIRKQNRNKKAKAA